MTTATIPTTALVPSDAFDGHFPHVGPALECATADELVAAAKHFQKQLNPCRAARPRTGFRRFVVAGQSVVCTVNEAARGTGLHARATFSLNGRRATLPAIIKALAA
jgi:hypothetical protein